jgi:diguanylate cyclase (GGDEF)-like protein
MTAGFSRASDPSLAERLSRAFVAVAVLIAATLAVTAMCFAAVLGHFEPSVHDLLAGEQALNETHNGMLDAETGLRGYLPTGAQAFLSAYYVGEHEILVGDSASLVLATRPDLIGPILNLRVAQQRWLSEWATPALTFERAVNGDAAQESFLLRGKTLFDEYRAANNAVNAQVDIDISAERSAQYAVILIALGIVGMTLAATIVVARRQHRALRAAVVEPLSDLLSTMRTLASGDLTARPTGVGPPELREVGVELGRMTDTLAAERHRIELVEREARSQAARLGLIVNVGREISGSLSLRYVAQAVSKAALSISGFETARLWLIDEIRRELTALHTTDVDQGPSTDPASLQLGEGLVGRAGQFGRTLSALSTGALATEYRAGSRIAALGVPMIVGTRIIGVFELMSSEPIEVDEMTLDVLHSLAGQAATAVEAARFHQNADELSHTDALTRLPNRRRLELDLDLEITRSLRYDRPIAFIMLDVDHFKDINDIHGHQAGDEILSEFGDAFTPILRETDTAYRYGGEEFCVLLRETDAASAAIVAERLRIAIANRFAGNQGSAMVTASLGVAAIPGDGMDAKSLIAAADKAMYAAKASGRNCVMRANAMPTRRASDRAGRRTATTPRPVRVVAGQDTASS